MILREATVVYSGKRVEGTSKIRCAADVYNLCKHLADKTQECFCVVHLNTKHMVLSWQVVAIGSSMSVEVHPTEVFRAAVMSGAVAIILVHNHPSGDPEPSREDIAMTERLIECGKLMEISVLDHMVVGDESYKSFAESGILFAS